MVIFARWPTLIWGWGQRHGDVRSWAPPPGERQQEGHRPVPTPSPTLSEDPVDKPEGTERNGRTSRERQAGKGAEPEVSFTQAKAGNARRFPTAASTAVPRCLVSQQRLAPAKTFPAGAGAARSPPALPSRGLRRPGAGGRSAPHHARSELTQWRNVTAESPTCRRCCWGPAPLPCCHLAGGNAEGDIHAHTSQRRGGRGVENTGEQNKITK